MYSTLLLIISFWVFPPHSPHSFQVLDTKLEVTVRSITGNVEQGVEVLLFEKEDDYLSRAPVLAQGVTNEKGIVVFDKLKPQIYFLEAKKGKADNSEGGTKTESLRKGWKNKTTVVILE
jgi:hypothetical protein